MMRWVLLAGTYLVLAGCGMDFGTPGQLGEGEYHYVCDGPADPRCDYDFTFGDAGGCEGFVCSEGGGGCDSFCASAPSSLDESIPGAISVGARFSVYYESYSNWRFPVFSASEEMLAPAGGESFVAREPGAVAVLAYRYDTNTNADTVVDLVHVQIEEPTRIRVDRVAPDAPTTRDATGITLAQGQIAWLRALPVAGQSLLYGSLPCAWSEDASALSIVTDPVDNLIGVVGDATGLGELHLSLGSLERVFPVRVSDATNLNGGTP